MYRSRCCLKGREPLLDGGTHWRHLANTMNLSLRRWRCFLSVATVTVATCLVTYLDASRLCMDLNGQRVTLAVCLSVCLSVCWSRPSALQKRMNRSRFHLHVQTRVSPLNRVLDERARLNDPCEAAMRPYFKLL